MKIARDLAVNLIASVIFALIAFAASTWGLTTSIILGLVSALVGVSSLLIRNVVSGRDKPAFKLLGLSEITDGSENPVERMLDGARHSIDFLGVTANRTARSGRCREAILQVAENSGRVRFLLMKPSSESLQRRAADEGEQWQIWDDEIRGSVTRLLELRDEGVNISVRFYDHYPIFRMINIDNTEVRANWFLDGRPGHFCPELTLQVDRVGLSAALARHFEELWRGAEPVT